MTNDPFDRSRTWTPEHLQGLAGALQSRRKEPNPKMQVNASPSLHDLSQDLRALGLGEHALGNLPANEMAQHDAQTAASREARPTGFGVFERPQQSQGDPATKAMVDQQRSLEASWRDVGHPEPEGEQQ